MRWIICIYSGGISIKPSADMDQMRADMGGGACVLASFYTAARLKLPINIKGDVSPNVKHAMASGFSRAVSSDRLILSPRCICVSRVVATYYIFPISKFSSDFKNSKTKMSFRTF